MMTHFGTYYRLETGELTVFPPDRETPHTIHDGVLTRPQPRDPWQVSDEQRPTIVVCSWCESFKRTDNGWASLTPGSFKADLQRRGWRMSHGICPSCYETQMKKLQ